MTFAELKGAPLRAAQIRQYLDRIGLEAPERLDLAYLTRLQLAHQRAIPFDNLDLMAGKLADLERAHLFQKIVEGGRGGLCSELNGLYVWLLESLGYEVVSFNSRVTATVEPIQFKSHRVPCVVLDGVRYLTDVGYNLEHHRVPLRLAEGEQSDGVCAYRLERDEFWGWIMWQQIADGSWRKCLGFTEEPQIDVDFILPTFYASAHPSSRMNKFTKVSHYDESRCIAVREGEYLIEVGGIAVERTPITHIEQERELLRTVFHLPEESLRHLEVEEAFLAGRRP